MLAPRHAQRPPRLRARRSRARVLAAGLLLAGFALATSPAQAKPLNLRFDSFYDPDAQALSLVKNKGFERLMTEIGFAMGGRMIGPAQSLGQLGIEGALELSLVGVNGDADYWQDSVREPSSTVRTGQLRVRKGGPFGMQFGAVFTHMFDSDLYGIGAEVNMSLVDGYNALPDLALRIDVHTLVGNSNLAMLMQSTNLVISKSFGVGGVLSLQPWAAYSFGIVTAGLSEVVIYDENNQDTLDPDPPLRLDQVLTYSHRAAFGFRLVVTRVSVGAEFLRSFTDELNNVTLKLGVDF